MLAAAPVAEAIGAMGRTRRRQWVGLRRAGGVDLGWVEVGSSALWWGRGGVVARVVAAKMEAGGGAGGGSCRGGNEGDGAYGLAAAVQVVEGGRGGVAYVGL